MNRVILMGNVGKDPETRSVGSGTVANLSLATTEHFKDKSGEKKSVTQWHNLTVWGALAGVVERYVKKGSKLLVEGKIEYQSYEKNGETKYVTKINVSSIELLNKPEGSGNDRGASGSHIADAEVITDNGTDDLPF